MPYNSEKNSVYYCISAVLTETDVFIPHNHIGKKSPWFCLWPAAGVQWLTVVIKQCFNLFATHGGIML